MSEIIVSPSSGMLSSQSSTSTPVLWQMSPSGIMHRSWVLGQGNLASFDYQVNIPSYNLISAWSDYSEFMVEISINCANAPQWLFIENSESVFQSLGQVVVLDAMTYNSRVNTLSFDNLNLLSPGSYFADIKYIVTAVRNGSSQRVVVAENISYLNLQVTLQTVGFLEVESSFNTFMNAVRFSYFKDSQTLTSVNGGRLYVYSNTPFTVESVGFAVDIASFGWYSILTFDMASQWLNSISLGQSEHVFKIKYLSQEAKYTLRMNVYDNASGGSGGASINVLPSELSVDVYKNLQAPENQVVHINSSSVWNVSSQIPLWLVLSQNQGNGFSDVMVNFQNFNQLPAGVYTHILELSTAAETARVTIEMRVHDFIDYPFSKEAFYFTKNKDYLYFNVKDQEPVYMKIDLTITSYSLDVYSPKEYLRSFHLPLYKGQGRFHPGSVIHTLFEEIEHLNQGVSLFDGAYSRAQYAPVKVDISFGMYRYSSTEVVRGGKVPTILFIKGKKPFVTNRNLTLLSVQQQEYSRITPNSFIGVSYASSTAAKVRLYVNSILQTNTTSYRTAGLRGKIINSYFNFERKFNVGDNVELQIQSGNDTRTHRYLVFPEGVNSTHIIYENEHGVLEPFEFTGRVKIGGNLTHTLQKQSDGLDEFECKVDSIQQEVVSVDTGQLLPGDRYVIKSILMAKNVWMCHHDFKNNWMKVDATSNKTQLLDDFDNEIGMVVEFNVLERDARIYS